MAQGGPKPSQFYVERQALTRSPATPTNPGAGGALLRTSNQSAGQIDPGQGNPVPGDGLVLAGLSAIVVSVYPWTGQTISGGALLCWIFNPYQLIWTRCDELDLDLTSASGFQAKTFPTLQNISRLGMLMNYAFSSVTFSGGTDGLLRLDGFATVGGQ